MLYSRPRRVKQRESLARWPKAVEYLGAEIREFSEVHPVINAVGDAQAGSSWARSSPKKSGVIYLVSSVAALIRNAFAIRSMLSMLTFRSSRSIAPI